MQETDVNMNDTSGPTTPVIHVSPSPHLAQTSSSTRRMMVDVLIGLAPVVGMSLYIFRDYALYQLIVCLMGCLLAEFIFSGMRGRKETLKDGSAIVTAVILTMSLPGTAPWYVASSPRSWPSASARSSSADWA